MLLPDTSGQMAWLKAEALRIAFPVQLDASIARATVSGGIAEWRLGESLVDLMRRADGACYRAKVDGRDRVSSAAENDRIEDDHGDARSKFAAGGPRSILMMPSRAAVY
ncbi:hypothetical protein GGR46_000980 [Sphingomonas kyeonggiensis]|uniref:diguanylate cyclase n=2 Tax=Sphingomonas kyeonggiensis TaxID=1268553 RepID=A0A7W6NVG7_9SPHN|nr:hypothetical protein [Sphingomonas kyeonggiensis]